ncbi:hypothetical protein ACGFWF_07930 [Streptomyces sp. NPDC048581]|uniref:hypothetical protein n=1 Tax=Streptomyces sp. NPDC048581 TaxID=3365572 RepID=UPI00371F89FF
MIRKHLAQGLLLAHGGAKEERARPYHAASSFSFFHGRSHRVSMYFFTVSAEPAKYDDDHKGGRPRLRVRQVRRRTRAVKPRAAFSSALLPDQLIQAGRDPSAENRGGGTSGTTPRSDPGQIRTESG